MKLTRTQAGMPTLVRDIDDVFDRFFNAPLPFPTFNVEPLKRAMEGTWMPAIDLTETEKEFIIRAEVPGIPRENLDVHLEGDIVTLTGHREKKLHEENENLLWEEREAGKFLRTIRLPKAVEGNKVEASYQEGVLTVKFPKAQTAVKNKILIKA
ncbi:MAG TPA: Hsp20/alpha crystallin family protein [Gemmatimonadales bacterium]|nr:Hsp20/alpha crystallin family protein [Gemmatimonadales bacterium]